MGALYVGKAFFIPVALAIFFHAMLRPLIRRIELFRIPTAAAATLVLFGLLGVLGGGIAMISGPAKNWMENAPDSFHAAEVRFQSWWEPVRRVTDAAADLGQTAGNGTAPVAHAAPPAAQTPQFLAQLFGTTATIIAGGVEVLLLLYLLMSSGGVFLQRLVSLLPARADKRTAVAISTEVEAAVSGYLFATLLINVGEGILVGILLKLLGMPDPLFWGILTFVLRAHSVHRRRPAGDPAHFRQRHRNV